MRSAYALLAGLLTGLLAACAAPAPSTPSQDASVSASPTVTPAPRRDGYADPQGRFSLVPPRGWTVNEDGPPGTEVIFTRPAAARGSFHPNVNVVVVPSEGDLSSIVVASRKELGRLTAFRSTIDVAFTLADGAPGHLLGGTFMADPVTFRLRNELAVATGRERTVVVTATAPAQDWPSVAATFDAVLRSLTLAG